MNTHNICFYEDIQDISADLGGQDNLIVLGLTTPQPL